MVAARRAGFDARAKYAPDDVLRHVECQWRYIPVHPFADDQPLLARIGWEAARCLSVDAYWECDEDVYFVQVEAEGQSTRARGLYYRWSGDDVSAANLVAVVEPRPILRESFESALRSLAPHLPRLGRSKQLSPLRS